MHNINLATTSSKQTRQIAGLLTKELFKTKIKQENSLVLALQGDLGGGKTTFAQGFLRGAGIRKKITSPTFVLVKIYNLKPATYNKIYHIDCYRLKTAKEILDLGLGEILASPKNIILIEWPEKIKKHLPKNHILVKFKHGKKENERIISIK